MTPVFCFYSPHEAMKKCFVSSMIILSVAVTGQENSGGNE